MKLCKKIDVHAHASLFMEAEYQSQIVMWPEELLRIYDMIGVERGVLLPITSPEGQSFVMSNGATYELTKRYPDRFSWFCNIDPRAIHNLPDTDFSGMIRHFQGLGALGMGELTANMYADDPLLDNLFSYCAEYGMPVTIHINPTIGNSYGIVDEVGLPRLEKMLKKHTKLKILGHSQPFWAEIDAGCNEKNRCGYPKGKVAEGALSRLMRECPNLYCDMSAHSGCNAMMRDPDYAYRFIEEFADRMLFAIDACKPYEVQPDVVDLANWLDESAQKGCISEKNYRAICRGNAIRLLGLDMDPES